MSCSEIQGCSKGGCTGCRGSSAPNGYETAINSISELEIHYSDMEEIGSAAYIFKDAYCLTNIMANEKRVTGLEGRKFESLYEMSGQVMDCLMKSDGFSCKSFMDADIIYIRDDE